METLDIGISPKYKKSHWLCLDLENNNLEDWKVAVEIFRDRIEGRFLSYIDLIENHPKSNIHSGFIIMSIDCLLIETLEQFYKGKIRTGGGMDDKAFYNFFQRSALFKSFFNNQKKATVFYSHIRCGLLHQAQTKKKSR